MLGGDESSQYLRSDYCAVVRSESTWPLSLVEEFSK